MRRPWEAIRAAMQEELADLSWTELFFGTAFLAAGSAALGPPEETAGTGCVPARALFHTAPRCVEIRKCPPRGRGRQVLVRTVCSGISGGTERLAYRGEVLPSWRWTTRSTRLVPSPIPSPMGMRASAK